MNNNADNKPGVMIYFDIIPLIEEMNPENAGQLFLAILKYAQYGEVPSLSGLARSVWPFIKSLVDRDSRRYDIARKKKQWATYCRDAKRRGEEPLDFNLWLSENGRSPLINADNHNSSLIIDDDECYPTTTTTTPPSTPPSTDPSTSPFSSSSTDPSFCNTKGNARKGGTGEKPELLVDSVPVPNRPPSALGSDYIPMSPEQEEAKREAGLAMLAGYPR